MTNPGREIRTAIVDLLKTPFGDPPAFPTDAGGRVFNSSDSPGDVDAGREINVYLAGETLDPSWQHQGGGRRRIMDLRIECYHYGTSGADSVDDMRWQVEETIRRDPTIGRRVEWCRLKESNIFFAEQGDVAMFAAVTAWEVIYYTVPAEDEAGRPTTVLLGFSPDIGPGHEPDYTVVYESLT